MARMTGENLIRQKIAELTQQITHFEQCIKKAREHQVTLQQALVALQSDPFSSPIKRKAKSISDGSAISIYAYHPSDYIAKVFKHYPNQWMSAKEIMFKAFEIEGKIEHKSQHHSIVTAFSHALRRLQEKGIVEKQVLQEKSSVRVIQWR
ncbi:hypothetical protein B0186_11415 [Canicola haemoglobinophilus]|uniref:Uncharacterized protein n=1 Tax=Canicola haemoglobinophilus TaxID=733 RepID=A0A1V4AY99_9PAST|nr:hypothetical protein [Canicola haemoglobinophilus]OOR95127.1 hypothetical protein B0186_11415 [Canicola haemoglobinophilus]STO55393.1 Uncharacterised protein [Canicola haemoglobinophilus]STO59696.1 Uncharacterised protein [Canicola haemoglobinophilus]STO69038.1 Uncharacterised protein [Canicola haemoglobinophilus]STO91852.1 Uncharacterised protein [Canicola haemoglobinophilus]